MDQRMLLFFVLSGAIIFGYFTLGPVLFPDLFPPPTTRQAIRQDSATTGSGPPVAPATAAALPAPAPRDGAAAPPPPQTSQVPAREILVETPLYIAKFDSRGARLVSLQLKNFRRSKNTINWGDVLPPLRSLLPKEPVDTEARVEMVKREVAGTDLLGVEFLGEDALTQAIRRLDFSTDRGGIRLTDPAAGAQTLEFFGELPEGGSVVNPIAIRKRLTFHPDSYVIEYEVQVINYGKKTQFAHLLYRFGEGPIRDKTSARLSVFGPMYFQDGSVEFEDAEDIAEIADRTLRLKEPLPEWLGITDKYFLTAVATVDDFETYMGPGRTAPEQTTIQQALYQARNLAPEGADAEWAATYGMERRPEELQPKKMIASKFLMYLGPQEVKETVKLGKHLEESFDLTINMFINVGQNFLGKPLLKLLRWFESFTGNFGVSIIMLTIVVRVALFPLTYKGMVSMKRMAKLQPKMKEIREKYKKDKEKINQEMIGLYKRYKVNPLGGCLPIALQIPIFFALFASLSGAVELRHAEFFGWIQDLSTADPLFITPLLMGGSMFLQQRLTPTSMDPTQQKIMMWMPLIFMVFMFNFPSGLVLYWLTSNTLSILQQLVINRVKIPDLVEKAA